MKRITKQEQMLIGREALTKKVKDLQSKGHKSSDDCTNSGITRIHNQNYNFKRERGLGLFLYFRKEV